MCAASFVSDTTCAGEHCIRNAFLAEAVVVGEGGGVPDARRCLFGGKKVTAGGKTPLAAAAFCKKD
jgi:hypothetical protein